MTYLNADDVETMMDDLATTLTRMAGGERSKAEAAETPFRQGLHEARARTMEQAADRIAALEAALKTIADAKEPMLHHPHRDQCTHGRSPDVECPHCIRAFARAALVKP